VCTQVWLLGLQEGSCWVTEWVLGQAVLPCSMAEGIEPSHKGYFRIHNQN
jgi:hypothetical protein